MPKFAVRCYKTETNIVRCEITVEAADEAAARQRVEDAFNGSVELTEEEGESEVFGKEFVDKSEFLRMEDADVPFAVCEVV